MGNETDHAVDSKYAVEEDTTRLIHARDIYNDSAGKQVATTSKQIALESLLRCTIRGWYNSDVRDLEPDSAQQAGTETWQHDRNAQEIIKRNEGREPDDRGNMNTWLYADHGCDRDYANAPLKYVNPKGYVDSWRTPKYFYYLWQAVYAEKPMVFIHPHFWRSQYLGEKKEIVVDSNCDTVTLKVNGRVFGVLKPLFAEANVVRFKDVPIEKGVLTAEGKKAGQTVTASVVMADKPARLMLTSNPGMLEAGLDSVAVVRADIVDAEGNHVYGATNSIHWTVSGPATLVGPPVYTTDIDKVEATQGTMYIDAPAFNIIRSNGKPGEIQISVRSPGLVGASVRLVATAAPKDTCLAIVEPPLLEGRRLPVAREGGLGERTVAAVAEMKGVSEDLLLTGASLEDYARQVDQFLRRQNPGLDFSSPEYRAAVSAFARLLQSNQGSLVRDDFNFTVGFYNDCRRITRQVSGLKAPALYKQTLIEYYARSMIEQGEARDYETETRWLAAIPDGKLAACGALGNTTPQPGVLYSQTADLGAMVTLALPEFKAVDAARKPALLEAVCVLNPWVQRKVRHVGGERVDGKRTKTTEMVSYQAGDGRFILVPPLAWLEAHAADTKAVLDDGTQPVSTKKKNNKKQK
jgi:hypothetical protein